MRKKAVVELIETFGRGQVRGWETRAQHEWKAAAGRSPSSNEQKGTMSARKESGVM